MISPDLTLLSIDMCRLLHIMSLKYPAILFALVTCLRISPTRSLWPNVTVPIFYISYIYLVIFYNLLYNSIVLLGNSIVHY